MKLDELWWKRLVEVRLGVLGSDEFTIIGFDNMD